MISTLINSVFRLILLSLLVLCALVISNPGETRPFSRKDIVVTRNLDGSPLPTRENYLRHFPESELTIYQIDRVEPQRDNGTVAVVINDSHYNALEEIWDAWIESLQEDEYEPILITIEGGTAQEVKDMVIDEGGDGLIGVIFAGELPLAWYEHREHFYNENEPDNQRIIEYPIDLFFTDLDGVWEDTTGNGIYDHHYGEVDPDIWLGRIPAYNLSRIDENEIVGAYLQKTIQYKQNELSAPHKALNYIDDDWDRLDEKWTADIRNLFGEITSESDSNTTCVPDYVEHLEGEGYELIQVAVHSSSDAHIFYIDNRSNRDYFRFWDLRDDIVPNAMFYNLFACSVMNFAPQENRPRNLCLGVLYALGGEYGLGSIGSTKTGGMLSFDDFYQPLSDGDCFGEALRKWMVEHAHEEDNPNWARSWFYGMTYYGDPTLKIRQGLRINSPIAFDPEGDNDLILDAGETVELICNLANKAEIPFENITLNLECANENVEIINGQVEIDGIDAGEEIQAFGFQFAVNESFLNNDRISFNLEMSMENDIWRDWFELTVKAPVLEIVGFGIGEVSGNGNNLTEPGETGELIIHFQNTGGDDMHQEGQVHLTDMRNFIEIEDNPGVLPLTEIGNIGFSQLFNFSVSGDAENEQIIYLDVENSINGVMRGQGFIGLPVSTAFEFDEYLDLEPVWFKHYSLSDNFYDFWRWDEDAGLDGGGFAIGGPDSTEYPPFCDAALELPLFLYDSDAILEVQHRFDVEPEYDACVIEINRGEGWVRAIPDDGYNGRSFENGTFPGGDCWNGTSGWINSTISLGDESGPARIRFRFSSDIMVQQNGWFIDHITINGDLLEIPPKDAVKAEEFELLSVYPNPFNSFVTVRFSIPDSRTINLKVFDLSGRLVQSKTFDYSTPGIYSLNLNAENLTSGIYHLNLTNGSDVLLQKVVLLK